MHTQTQLSWQPVINLCRLQVIREQATDYMAEVEAIKGSEHAAQTLCQLAHLHEQAEEYFFLITLDTRHNIRGIWEVSHGSINESVVHPREIFKRALSTNSDKIMVAHNHPSGDISPSPQDDNLTERIQKAGQLIGVKVLDHIIIGDSPSNYYSYAEERKL